VLLLPFRCIPRKEKDVKVSNIIFAMNQVMQLSLLQAVVSIIRTAGIEKASEAYLSHCSSISFGKLKNKK
jgi:hypothetical protein